MDCNVIVMDMTFAQDGRVHKLYPALECIRPYCHALTDSIARGPMEYLTRSVVDFCSVHFVGFGTFFPVPP